MPIITQPVFTKSGSIRYQSHIQQPDLNTSNPTLHKLYRLIQNHSLEFSLNFSGTLAHFEYIKSRELQDFEAQFLLSILQFKESIIHFKAQKVASKFHSKWLVSETKYLWNITGKARIYMGMRLEHAETSILIKRHLKPDFNMQVNAWFTRTLPYFFGPMGFYGLPGLITILEMDKICLTATDIRIDDEFCEHVFWNFE